MRILGIQNHPVEGFGLIDDWALSRGRKVDRYLAYDGDAGGLPDPLSPQPVMVMGGPMSVNDAPHNRCLANVIDWLQRRIGHDLPTLGICLGAQMIAVAGGSTVSPQQHKEIGWFPIQLTANGKEHPLFNHLPAAPVVMHWHGEVAELPHKARLLATSEACTNQAFIIGDRVVALQFHLESTPQSLAGMCREFVDELESEAHSLTPSPYVQDAETIMDHAKSAKYPTSDYLFALLDKWTKRV